LEWARQLSILAETGYPQLAVVAVSLLLVAKYLVIRTSSKITRPEGHASTLSLPFELASQVLRASALALVIVAAVRHGGAGSWANVGILGYAFVLGLLRLVDGAEWRHVALHHVNFSLFGAWVILITAKLLPTIDASWDGSLDRVTVASVATVSTAVFVAFVTHREWQPPSLDLDLPENVANEPSPEETCSWLEYYVTYEWLTPLVWRGCRRQMTTDELPGLPWYDEPLLLLKRVQEAREKGKSTLWTLVRFLPFEMTTMASWISLCFVIEYVSPFALFKLLGYIEAPEEAVIRPWVWLVLLFIGPLTRSVSFQQYM
jgi:hypothetical protein